VVWGSRSCCAPRLKEKEKGVSFSRVQSWREFFRKGSRVKDTLNSYQDYIAFGLKRTSNFYGNDSVG
jgi:hypothetical protein